ncbi:MAG: M24 family metallopeptidase [Pseudomonadota bacterium]
MLNTDTQQVRIIEVEQKLAIMRSWLGSTGASVLRLRGTDWFAWATAGGSNTVLLTAETGVAEIVVGANDAYLLTDDIEALRLREEEVPDGYAWYVSPWAEPQVRERFVAQLAVGGVVLADRPAADEIALTDAMLQQRYRLTDSERARYRQVGRLAAQAMTEVLGHARPDWSEFDLAGAGAEALWSRGLHPALTLAAGERRLPRYRHTTPSKDPLGSRAMLVFCARGYGLYANLTRFVHFGPSWQHPDQLALQQIEAAGLAACQPGALLSDIYIALDDAYRDLGFTDAIRQHHQGGITGYLARERVAAPHTAVPLAVHMAVAFNPSLPGTKLEDTFLLSDHGLENVTLDPEWPSVPYEGQMRPLPLEGANGY